MKGYVGSGQGEEFDVPWIQAQARRTSKDSPAAGTQARAGTLRS